MPSMYSVACGISWGRRSRGRPSPPTSWPRTRRPPRLGPPLLGRPLDDLVVDVGDVGDVVHVEPGEDQVAAQDVEDQVGPAVADVGQVIDRRPADVHGHLPASAARAAGRCPLRCREGAAPRYGNPIMSTPRTGAPGVPDKPSLEGLEERWAAAWEDAAPTASTPAPAAPRSSPSTRRRPRCRARSTWAPSSATCRPTPSPASGGCRAGGLLPDGLGRQRPAHRAAGAELLRRACDPSSPTTRTSPAGEPGKDDVP